MRERERERERERSPQYIIRPSRVVFTQIKLFMPDNKVLNQSDTALSEVLEFTTPAVIDGVCHQPKHKVHSLATRTKANPSMRPAKYSSAFCLELFMHMQHGRCLKTRRSCLGLVFFLYACC